MLEISLSADFERGKEREKEKKESWLVEDLWRNFVHLKPCEIHGKEMSMTFGRKEDLNTLEKFKKRNVLSRIDCY